MRNMCHECPFRPGSPKFHRRDGWLKVVMKRGSAHGCHLIEDTPDHKPENVCVGSVDAIEGRLHEKEGDKQVAD